jgi:hypothetical protein
MARSTRADAVRTHPLTSWIILKDQAATPISHRPPRYDASDALRHGRRHIAEVQARLPPDLERSARAMTDPPEVVEIWFGPEA